MSINCPKCGGVFEDGKYCPYCGSDVSIDCNKIHFTGDTSNNAGNVNEGVSTEKPIAAQLMYAVKDESTIPWYYKMWFITIVFWLGCLVLVGPIVAIVLLVMRMIKYPQKRKNAFIVSIVYLLVVVCLFILPIIGSKIRESRFQGYIDSKNYNEAFKYVDDIYSSNNYEYYSKYADIYDAMGKADDGALKILDYCNSITNNDDVNAKAIDRLFKYRDKVSDGVKKKIEEYLIIRKEVKKAEEEKKQKSESKEDTDTKEDESSKLNDIEDEVNQTKNKSSVTKDEIEENAVSASWKDIARNPDDYKGEYIVLDVCIGNQFEEDEKMYGVYEAEYNEYLGWMPTEYSYVINDCQDEKIKYLENDIIKVYGVIVGVEDFSSTNKITGYERNEKVPVIDVYYTTMISE